MNYSDPIEAAFAFEISSASGRITNEFVTNAQGQSVPLFAGLIDVGAIDDFVNSGHWDQGLRAELLEERRSAFSSYEQGEFDIAMQKMIALHRRCEQVGFMRAVKPLVELGKEASRYKKSAARKEAALKAMQRKKPE